MGLRNLETQGLGTRGLRLREPELGEPEDVESRVTSGAH